MAEFTLVMEYIGKKQRGIVGIAIWWSWISTLLVLVLLAYLIPSWRTLSIITSSPGLLFFLLWWFVPESLRWLLVKGKNKEACDILKAAAKINNRAITDETLDLLEKDVKSSERLGDVRDLFANRFVTHRILVSWYCWFVSTMVYYGITLSSPSIGGSMYLNFFITTVCEAFAMMVAIASLQWLGRRKSMAFSLWLAGLVGIVAAVLSYFEDGSEGYEAGKILMAMVLGKIFITIAFDVVYLYSSELFPTVVRNTAMGTSTSAGRIGSASAPYIVFSQRVHPLMPFGIMAVNALICGILCMTLPETKDKAMPDTIQQVGKNNQDSGIKFIDKGVPTADDEKTKLAPNNIMIETMA